MRPPRLSRLALLVAALAAAPALRRAAAAEPAPKVTALAAQPRAVLWVGNSYVAWNDGVNRVVQGLARAGDPDHAREYASAAITIGGAALTGHDVEAYLRTGAAGPRALVRDDEGLLAAPERRVDVVLLQDCSRCTIDPKLREGFLASVRKDVGIVRAHGATPVLFMTWAYANRPELAARIAEQYTRAGNANDVLVVPAGLAFARALREDPKLALHAPDGSHPSVEGTYLAACTAYAALWGRSPVGNAFTGAVAPKAARFLQGVAWETVRDYHGGGAR